MKKKVLIGFIGIAIFALTIALNSQKNEIKDLTIKNAEAIADEPIPKRIHCHGLIFYCEYADHTPDREPKTIDW